MAKVSSNSLLNSSNPLVGNSSSSFTSFSATGILVSMSEVALSSIIGVFGDVAFSCSTSVATWLSTWVSLLVIGCWSSLWLAASLDISFADSASTTSFAFSSTILDDSSELFIYLSILSFIFLPICFFDSSEALLKFMSLPSSKVLPNISFILCSATKRSWFAIIVLT